MRTHAHKPKPMQQSHTANLQRAIGNQAIQRMLQAQDWDSDPETVSDVAPRFGHDFSRIPVFDEAPLGVQTKLMVSTPGDKYEREADRVADQVMRMSTHGSDGSRAPALPSQRLATVGLIQRSVEAAPEDDLVASDSEPMIELDEEEEPLVQTKPGEGRGTGVRPAALATGLRETAAGGRPLAAKTRSYMEPRFGFDFSTVRVHHDSASDCLSRGIGAAAFTHGRHIYFRAGRYAQETSAGRQLLAHELTHVVQQSGGNRPANKQGCLRRSLQGAPNRPQISPVSPGSAARYVQMKREVDVQLRNGKNKVRIVDGNKVHKTYTASAGPATVSLMKKMARHSLYEKRKPGRIIGNWGLNYFAMFKGGYGFHSNIARPRKKGGGRKRVVLIVDGSLKSHGCVRLRHKDSVEFYHSVSKGTPINLMTDFSKLGGTKGGSAKGGATTHVVKSGDTVSELAESYGVSQEAIEKANPGKIHGDEKVIRLGDTLIIPKAK